MARIFLVISIIFFISSCSHSIYLETYADIKAERFKEALEKIDKYNIKNKKEDQKLLTYKAYALFKLGRFEEAIKILEKQLKKSFNNEIAQALLMYYKEYALYLERNNRKEKSIFYYKKYIKLSEQLLDKI